MSKERDLLARVLTSELWSVQEELQAEIKQLLAQPEQEPVAWMWDEMFCEDWTTVSSVIKPSKSKYVDNVRPLYLAPPKREPLSDAQIAELWGDKHSGKTYMVKNFARAIEKECGIRGGE